MRQSANERKRMRSTDGFIRTAWYQLKYLRFRDSLPCGAIEALRIVESQNPFSDYREPIETNEVQPANWSRHNANLVQIERDRIAAWKADRLARIRERKQRVRLARAIATYHRKNPELTTTPIVQGKQHPPLPLLDDDRTEPELRVLLESVPESYRLDVSAECWIVRNEHPSIPALHVFRRAVEVCRMVRRGVYSDRERMNQAKNGLPESMASASRQSAITSARWYLSQGYDVLRRDRLQFVAMLVQSQLDPAIVEGILAGMTQKEIAAKTGRCERTILNRINKARDFAPAIAASAPLLRYVRNK